MPRPAPRELLAGLLLYVLPLAATAAGLALVGLPVLALGLLGAEAVVVTTVVLVRRRPPRAAREPVSGSRVVVVLGLLVVVVAVAGVVVQATLGSPR